jgi:reactive intermediate/imine deaminase
MPDKTVVQTNNAPRAIGTYSQAIRVRDTVYLSGQIPLLPDSMEIISEDIGDQIRQVFNNIAAVCQATGGEISQVVKLTIYLIDLSHFSTVNEIMSEFFSPPYPARAVIGVKSLPRDAQVEMDGIMVL